MCGLANSPKASDASTFGHRGSDASAFGPPGGHIDWLLTAHEYAKDQATVHALRVGVATELMVPPLPPRQPSEVPSLPPGGCIFPSDHYPVFADVQLVPRR